MDLWRENHGADEKPNIPGIDECQLVLVALWLKDVRLPAVLLDRERFLTEPSYALPHVEPERLQLPDRAPGRARREFPRVERRPPPGLRHRQRRLFRPAVALLQLVRPELGRPAGAGGAKGFDRTAFARSGGRTSTPSSSSRRWSPTPTGSSSSFRPVRPRIRRPAPRRDGTTVQFGLTEDEIDDVWERIEDLIEDVDDGDLPVF